jgi:hypothetical protein
MRNDQPFPGPAAPAAIFYDSPESRGDHPDQHLAGCSVK